MGESLVERIELHISQRAPSVLWNHICIVSKPLTMFTSSIAALVLLAGTVTAKTCINATVPVTISARQGTFDWAVPQTSIDVPDFFSNVTRQGSNFTAAALSGYHTTAGTYNISTQFCMPSSMTYQNPTVQVLTHGIGFDKT